MLFVIICLQSVYNRTKVCTPKKTLFDLTDSNYDSIIGFSRAVFVRMENEGCPYAKTSQHFWEEAAELFPNIQFVRAECIYNNAVCQRIGAENSPSHALFGPNSQTKLDYFDNPSSISSSSTYYADVIYRQLGFYPLDTASITELLPQSTHIFFESYKYPIFLLYDSSCEEDSDFISRWIIDVTDNKISSEDYGFGRLDCSKFPDECQKWGAKVPSANVFSREKAISVSITEHDSISNRVKSVVSFLNRSDILYPTPAPFEDEETSPPFSEIENVKTITIDDLQNRKMESIRSKYNEAKQPSYSGDDFTGAANVYSCSDVQLKNESISNVLRLVNFYRELAGLPSDITNDESLNEGCYYAAKYSSRVGFISHYVNELFKDYCGDFNSNWETIKTTLQRSNLAQGQTNILPMISGLIDDEGENNEGSVGHRRWLLYPYLRTIGVGFYPISYRQMTGYKFQYPPCGVFSVSHGTYSIEEYNGISFISWPPPGPFPIERLPSSWSVYYKEFQRGEGINTSNIILRITRDDGQILDCSRVDLSNTNAGLPGHLIFKLTDDSLNLITAGHSIHVQVYFLKDSTRDLLDYTIDFFDNQSQESICFYNKDRSKCPSSILDSNKFGEGQYSNYKASSNTRTIIHVVENITVSKSLRFDFSQYIIVKGNQIDGQIIIGMNNEVDIQDPSSTDFVIETDQSNLKSGLLRTSKKAKSIQISFTKDPTSKSRIRSLFYIGSYTKVNFVKRVVSSDYIYYFGLSYKGSETYLVCTPISNAEYLCQGNQYYYDDYIDSSIDCHVFSELSELSQLKTEKKIIKIFSEGILEISSRVFPNNFANYYFYSGNKLTLEFSFSLENKARIINISSLNKRQLNPTFRFSEIPYGKPSLYDKSLKNVFPFTNLYLSNVAENIVKEQYSIPDLLGDEAAKELLSIKETEVYDESIKPFANSDGSYKYPAKSYNSGTYYNPLFITNGIHDEYTFSRSEDDANVNLRIKPTESTSSKHITFRFLSPENDRTSVFQKIFIQNYHNVTIMAEVHSLGNYFSVIQLFNVTKARFVDFSNKPVTGVTVDVIGNSVVDLSSEDDNPVTFKEIFFRNDGKVECKNSKAKYATVVESNPTIQNLETNGFCVVNSIVKLVNSSVDGKVEIYLYYQYVSKIHIKENTVFNPSEIKLIIYNSYIYSKSLLSLNDELSLLVSGLDPQTADSLLSKIKFYDSFNSFNSPIDDYKVILTKDKSGLYLVQKDFDETKAPDSVLIKDIEENEDDLILDENYEINGPPPNVPLIYNNPNKKKKKFPIGAIIGIVVGAVVFVVLIALLIACLIVHSRNKKERKNVSENEGKDDCYEDSVGL